MYKTKHSAIIAGILTLTLAPAVAFSGSISGYAADTDQIETYGGKKKD